jgi:predicted anti-sigma-YlaC factor YlaD
MLTCLEVSRLASESLERDLPLLVRIQVQMHLLMCPPCKRYVQQVRFLREVSRTLLEDLSTCLPGSACLSETARERIRKAIQASA